jgi:hypothetical protein
MANPVHLTASAAVPPAGVGVTLTSIVVAGTGTVNLRNGSTVAAPIKAVVAGPGSPNLGYSGLYFSQGCFVDIGTGVTDVTVGTQ